MNWYKMIYGWYNSVPKRWTIDMVRDAVIVGKITEQEFLQITGESYTVESILLVDKEV